MSHIYILDGKNPVPCDDICVWGTWFAQNNELRTVARREEEDMCVSTVFIGVDHSSVGDKAILFETMVFSPNEHDEECVRYSTWEEAEAGHSEVCNKIFGKLMPVV